MLGFVNLTHAGKREPQLKKCLHQIGPVDKSVGRFLKWVIGMGGHRPQWEVPPLDEVVLGWTRKQTEGAIRSRRVSRNSPSVPCLQIPVLTSLQGEWKLCAEINPFRSTLLSVAGFITAAESKVGHKSSESPGWWSSVHWSHPLSTSALPQDPTG